MDKKERKKFYKKANDKWNHIAKPIGGLGEFEEYIKRIAALKGDIDFTLKYRTLLIAISDNGVIKNKVSQSDESVTLAVAKALGEGKSTANILSKDKEIKVLPIDVGMKEDTPHGVLNEKIRRGTRDIKNGSAMTRDEFKRVVNIADKIVKNEKENGCDILLLGEMGIGNTTTSTAIASVLLNKDPKKITGRGAGLSNKLLKNKINVIKKAIEKNSPYKDPIDPEELIIKLGGYDIAFLYGVILSAKENEIPVILDGAITNVSAYLSYLKDRDVLFNIIPSHISNEKTGGLLLKKMGLKAPISAGMHLGEGSGAILLLSLLDRALLLYNDKSHNFFDIGIDDYKVYKNK